MSPAPLRRERPGRRIAYVFEAALAWPLYGLIWLLPLDWASGLGSVLARAIGPLLTAHRRARHNLARAYPEKSDAEIEAITRGMWDNLGRVALEYPQLRRIRAFCEGARIEVNGAEHLERVRKSGGSGIFFAAHLGNWEVPSIAVLHGGVPITLIYRAANNPFVEPLVRRTRRPSSVSTIAKGPSGARQTLALLRKGGVLGMLVDQKMNDGIPVPFFGRPAMTAPALAQFALKYRLPVVPVQVERLKGAHFRVTFHPPLKLPEKGATPARVAQIMGRVNAMIEGWVRARPEQWLWAHRRWPD